MDALDDATRAIAAVHEFVDNGNEDSMAPLLTLIGQVEEAISQPSADALPHAGLRADLAALLYNSHNPPDVMKWIQKTHTQSAEKGIYLARKRIFDLFTNHLDKYETEVVPHAHVLLSGCIDAFEKEQGADSVRQAELRTFRKALRRLPSDHGLTYQSLCGRAVAASSSAYDLQNFMANRAGTQNKEHGESSQYETNDVLSPIYGEDDSAMDAVEIDVTAPQMRTDSRTQPYARADAVKIANAHKLSVQRIWEILIDELRIGRRHGKTSSSSTKESLLKTLGLVAELYWGEGQDISSHCDDLADVGATEGSTWWNDQCIKLHQLCLGFLREEFFSRKKSNIEMSIVAGSFACLERLGRRKPNLVTCIGGKSEREEVNSETLLWTCLRRAIHTFATTNDVKRYEVPSKALRFVARHADKLVAVLSLNASKIIPIFKICALHPAAKIRMHAVAAYEATFAAVATHACASAEPFKVVPQSTYFESYNKEDSSTGNITAESEAAQKEAYSAFNGIVKDLDCINLSTDETELVIRALDGFIGAGGAAFLQGKNSYESETNDECRGVGQVMSKLLMCYNRIVSQNNFETDGHTYNDDDNIEYSHTSPHGGDPGFRPTNRVTRITIYALRAACTLLVTSELAKEGGVGSTRMPTNTNADSSGFNALRHRESECSTSVTYLDKIGDMVEFMLSTYSQLNNTEKVAVTRALAIAFQELLTFDHIQKIYATMSSESISCQNGFSAYTLTALLERVGHAGVIPALTHETRACPQAVPVIDRHTGLRDTRLCWTYAKLWSDLLNAETYVQLCKRRSFVTDGKIGKNVGNAVSILQHNYRIRQEYRLRSPPEDTLHIGGNAGPSTLHVSEVVYAFLMRKGLSYLSSLDLR